MKLHEESIYITKPETQVVSLYSRRFTMKDLKKCANKVKQNAPLMKSLGNDPTIQGSELLSSVVKECKHDMKTLYDTLRKVFNILC